MINGYGLAALGRDMEMRTTPTGKTVGRLSLAFSLAPRGAARDRATQWVDASLWGPRAEALQAHMLKGTKVCVSLSNVHIEEYDSGGERRTKLVADVADIAFAGAAKAAEPKPPSRTAPKSGTSFDDMDDDIPF